MKKKFLVGLIWIFGFVVLTNGICSAERVATIQSLTDYGEDTDGDGLYEYLIAEISVSVESSMIFTIEGGLYSGEDLIMKVYNSTYLNRGINVVKFSFDGKRIRESRFDGPYTVIIILYDKQRHRIDEKGFGTSPYQHNEFRF